MVEWSTMRKSREKGNPKAEFRELIIQEARKNFARFGFRKTSVDEIAGSLRMGKSSLYYYFRTKDEMFEAVLHHEADLFRSEIAREVGAADTAQQKLGAYVITRMRVFRDLINFYQAFKDRYLENVPFVEKFRKEYDLEEASFIKDILQDGVTRGEFHMNDPQTASIALVTLLKGLEFRWAESQNEEELSKHGRDLLEVLFHGILRR